VAILNDDRIGWALDRLFDTDISIIVLKVAAHAVRKFDICLDHLHNDSTTITFHSGCESAERERILQGRLRLTVTWGYNAAAERGQVHRQRIHDKYDNEG
jgi:hypothetical protein